MLTLNHELRIMSHAFMFLVKNILTVTLITSCFMTLASNNVAFGQTTTPTPVICPPVYGGGTICPDNNILVDKKVKNPQSGEYVNNLDLTQSPFHPEDHVSFRIYVTNLGNSTLRNITVMDNLPQYLTVVQTPGTYDNSQKRVTMTIDSLNKNETKSFDLEFVLSPVGSLTNTAATFCLSNQAVAKIDKFMSNDSTQICVEKTNQSEATTKGGLVNSPAGEATQTPSLPSTTKGGLPVYQQTNTTKTPSTGAEALLIPLFGAATGAGVFLRKKFNIK